MPTRILEGTAALTDEAAKCYRNVNIRSLGIKGQAGKGWLRLHLQMTIITGKYARISHARCTGTRRCLLRSVCFELYGETHRES